MIQLNELDIFRQVVNFMLTTLCWNGFFPQCLDPYLCSESLPIEPRGDAIFRLVDKKL